MATAASRRISTGIAWGTFGVLALATLSILTSGGAAHAEEEPDGLLGTVTSIVAPVVTEVVTPVVTEVVAPILQSPVAQQSVPAVIDTVTHTVVEVPVVGPVVRPVLTPVAQVASDAVPAVTDLLQDSPVSGITTPILDAAIGVPGVGDLLSGLGVSGAVNDVAAVVDATTGLLGDTVDAALPPILGTLDPTSPGETAPDSADAVPSDTPLGIDPALITAAASAKAPATATTAAIVGGRSFKAGVTTLATVDDSADATGVPSLPAKAAHAPPSSPAPSSSAGHGAGSVGDGARLADTPVDSLHYWKRTLGAPDDDLPSSPVAETDTSPD